MDDYAEAIRFLEERTNYERALSIPYREMGRNLETLRRFTDSLDLPLDSTRVIHIAGTKGKGSTALMIEAILRGAGYRTGLFTSPHLFRLEERFAVNGVPAESGDLAEALLFLKERLRAFEAKEGETGLTSFELSVPAAYRIFTRKKADFIILETGLGGRIDATNICNPVLTVLTSIGYEHQKQLGKSLAEIAYEKAGIIKPGVPVVSGIGAPIPELPTDAEMAEQPPFLRRTAVTQETLRAALRAACRAAEEKGAEWIDVEQVEPGTARAAAHLIGAAQPLNAQIALTACHVLKRDRYFEGTEENALRAISEISLPARGEIVRKTPLCLVDGAHTRDSAKRLAESIARLEPHAPRTLVFAALADKEIGGMLWELFPLFDRVFLTEVPGSPRSVSGTELLRQARRVCDLLPSEKREEIVFLENLNSLFDEISQAPENGLYLFTGSFYFAAEVKRRLAC